MATGRIPTCDVEFFLLGKTGNGKSATGNTILGQEIFRTSDGPESATADTSVAWTTRNGLKIKVVDGPGLLDTRLNEVGQMELTESNLRNGFFYSPNGFHALVLVLRYGARFTDEETKTVKQLKRMLGYDFIRRHCILAFTQGESFSLKYRNGNFSAWCRGQTGDLRRLIDECNHRVVLFHNLTPAKGIESTNKLISLAMGLPRC